ncbi:MAG: hypothetical protein RTU92_04910 [Candidatus Thorarchaeota archaeon]
MQIRFFVTGMGRSGTLWTARLLDEDETVKVFHEPIGTDVSFFGRCEKGTINIPNYFKRRLVRMKAKIEKWGNQPWGEVNGYLRLGVPELQAAYNAPVVGLVRNPKLTIRSILRRRKYPALETEERFERICQDWTDAYEKLLLDNINIYTLESLNEDYDCFDQLCHEIGLSIPHEKWLQYAGIPIHWSIPASVPFKWDDWQMTIFDRVCGGMQETLGYAD